LSPQAYSNNLVDHHLVLDLVPPLAASYFGGRLPAPLSFSQAAILAVLGLQQHDIGKVCV
jgi:N-acetyltransferase 10